MKKQLKQKLNKTQSCIGTWITVPSVEMIDIISSSDIDFIVIDNEHSPISLEKAQLMTMVAHKNNTSAILRVSSINKSEIQKATEINIDGIQIPNVYSLSDIDRIQEYSLYPPEGKKGLSPFTSSAKYFSADMDNFIASYNNDLLIIPQLEGVNVLENIDKILENKRAYLKDLKQSIDEFEQTGGKATFFNEVGVAEKGVEKEEWSMGQENFDKLVVEAREYIDKLEMELEDESTE